MTLKEIAAELNVSPSTVSRVLSGCNKNFSVKPELRQRILDRVSKRDYTPNPMYQAMRKKNNRQITIMLPNYLQDSDIGAGVDGINDGLYERGFSTHYLIRPLEQGATYGLPQWKVAGVIPVDVRRNELIRELDESDLPYVVLNGLAGPRGSAVLADDVGNMECLMEYLYRLGHRKIAYINHYRDPQLIPLSFAEQHYSVIRRTATYFDFCLSHGLPVLESAKNCSVTIEAAVEEGVARGFTAYVAYNFMAGIEISHYLRVRNLRIPEEASVVTFDNPHMAAFSAPPMTCLEIPVREMGGEAGRMLIELLENPGEIPPQVKMLPGKLVVRNSAAPVKNTVRQP